jgi:hypothetical protein
VQEQNRRPDTVFFVVVLDPVRLDGGHGGLRYFR